MSGEIEYLEKYSVAPSPSRDYYGLRVIRDKVILYIWKISHGPHKSPLVRTSSFVDFEYDKQLQEEIQRVFGKYLSRHVRNIASRKSATLLALPKTVIAKLVDHLTVHDIANLTTLSHVAKEIFDENFVWEILCKRYTLLTKKNDRSSTDWKQLFRLAQSQGLMKERKETRSHPPSGQTLTTKSSTKLENASKVSNVPSKGLAKSVSSTNQTAKKSSEDVRKRTVRNTVTKKPSDHRLGTSTIENHPKPEKKVPLIESQQMDVRKIVKTTESRTKLLPKSGINREANKSMVTDKAVESKSDKSRNRVRGPETKVGNTNVGTMEERPGSDKPKRSIRASSAAIEKSDSTRSASTRPKRNVKTKRIGQGKSTNLNANESLVSDRCTAVDDGFDFADSIEASLKNIRDSTSVFDYNPGGIERPKSYSGDRKGKEEFRKIVEHRILKNDRIGKTLDRLSEKSEPLTAESVGSNVSACSGRSSNSKMAKGKVKDVARTNKNRPKTERDKDRSEYFERYGIYKDPVPSVDIDDRRTLDRKKLFDKTSVLRSLGSTSSCGRLAGNDSLPTAYTYEYRKRISNLNKR
nr:uncharacterized protein LOC117218647 [Megalopta genalis]